MKTKPTHFIYMDNGFPIIYPKQQSKRTALHRGSLAECEEFVDRWVTEHENR